MTTPKMYDATNDTWIDITQEHVDMLIKIRNAYLSLLRDCTNGVTNARKIVETETSTTPPEVTTEDITDWVKDRSDTIAQTKSFDQILKETDELERQGMFYSKVSNGDLRTMSEAAYQDWANDISQGIIPDEKKILKMNAMNAEELRRTRNPIVNIP